MTKTSELSTQNTQTGVSNPGCRAPPLRNFCRLCNSKAGDLPSHGSMTVLVNYLTLALPLLCLVQFTNVP